MMNQRKRQYTETIIQVQGCNSHHRENMAEVLKA